MRQWELSLDQHGQQWQTRPIEDVTPRTVADIMIGQGTDLALAITLTHDPTADIRDYLRQAAIPAAALLVLGPTGNPGPESVPSGTWAAGRARAARDQARRAARNRGAQRIHLFIAGPQAIGLMLGHHWNLTPPATVYEHQPPGYFPAIDVS